MLKQASVVEVRQQTIPRENSVIVITMCYYPRAIKKEWRDEFQHQLAPDRELFSEWKNFEKKQGHDKAFDLSHYEERFSLSAQALCLLKIYSQESEKKDIYFVCQCQVGERCHREILLLIASKKYSAKVDKIFHDYPIFEKRIPELNDTIRWG